MPILLHTGRPVVVLAGWLGCQSKSLRRYEVLYQKFGFHVLSRIASPTMVVSATSPAAGATGRTPDRSRRGKNESCRPPMTMQQLGWDVVQELHTTQCSLVVFHGFSNGGCFLWESIRDILACDHDDTDDNEMVGSLRSKLAGVVFDSSPAYFMPGQSDKLDEALQYCTVQERIQVKEYQLMNPVNLNNAKLRAAAYWEMMRNDPWDVGQLYLYSEDDALTPYLPLEELVQHRRHLIGRNRIFSKSWSSSPHCTHLLTHQNEYEQAVESFLHACMHATPHAKL
jgi:hypothetical protein